MASISPESKGPKAAVGWENAAAAAGAVFAGWAAGRGKGMGVVAGLAAAAGVRVLANRRKEEAPSAPLSVPAVSEQPVEKQQPSMRELFDAPPVDSAAEHWQKMAMSLMEVVHAMATRPPQEAPSKPAPPTLDYAMGPLIWEPHAMPESRSDASGNTVWFGMRDLMPSPPKQLEAPAQPMKEATEAEVCEVILPPEPVSPPVLKEEPALPQVVVTAEIPPAVEAILTPAPVPLADEVAAQEALMQALQGEPVPVSSSPFAVAPEPPPVEKVIADTHPALAVDEFPTLDVVAKPIEFEHEVESVDVESLLKAEPEPEPEVSHRRAQIEDTVVPLPMEKRVVEPKEDSIFARLVARQDLDLNLPEPRPVGVSPKAFAPHVIPMDADGAVKPASERYAGAKLVPVAPNAETRRRAVWPRVLLVLAVFAVGLFVTVQWMTDGAFMKSSRVHRFWHGHESEAKVPAKGSEAQADHAAPTKSRA